MRVDVHTHAQPKEYLDALLDSGRYETVRDPNGQLVVRERGSRFLTITPQMHDPAQRVEEMDETDVDVQIISVTTPQVYFLSGQPAVDLARVCNDYLAELVQQYPTRFRALASVPLTANSDAAVREFERCLNDLNMVGAIIGANIDGRPIDDPSFAPFYELLNERKSTMLIHPMVPAGIEVMNQYALAPLVGFMMDTTLAVARLIFSGFFDKYPNVNVIAGHLGAAAPYLAGRFDIGYRSYPDCKGIDKPPSEYMKQMYLDTVSFHIPALHCAVETVGADRIVFGSDYPHVIGDVAGATRVIEEAVPASAVEDILGNTAAEIFGLG
jgi:aminocarboxymuconate-semialdehyde decarboxylase